MFRVPLTAVVSAGIVAGVLTLGGCGCGRTAAEAPVMPDAPRLAETHERPATQQTPSPEDLAGDIDPDRVGLEFYPGAAPEGSADVSGPVGDLMSINFSTSEEYEKVAEFYRKAYPEVEAEETISPTASVLTLEVSPPPDLRTVTVMKRKEADTVAITLMRHRAK